MKDKKTKIIVAAVAAAVVVAGAIVTVILINSNKPSGENKSSQDTSKTEEGNLDDNTKNNKSENNTSENSASNDGPKSGETKTTTTGDAVYKINGTTVKEVGVDMVGSTPNFLVIFDNSNNSQVEFDCANFKLEFSDGTTVQPSKSKKTLAANQSYIQWAFTFSKSGLKAGDWVTVYYGSDAIDVVQVGD